MIFFLLKTMEKNVQCLRKLNEANEGFIVIQYFLRGTSEHILFPEIISK